MSTERLVNKLPTVWLKSRLLCTLFRTYGLGSAMQGLWRYLRRPFTRSLALASTGHAHHTLPICKVFLQNTTPSWRCHFPNTSARRNEHAAHGALIHPQRRLCPATKAPGTSLFLSLSRIAGQNLPRREALSALRPVTERLDSVFGKSFRFLAISGCALPDAPALFGAPRGARGLRGEQLALSEGE